MDRLEGVLEHLMPRQQPVGVASRIRPRGHRILAMHTVMRMMISLYADDIRSK
jgi:hypothetical protein